MSSLEAVEAKRAARKAALKAQEDEQRATDLEAIDALETELGDSNIAIIELPYTPGLVVLAAAKTCPPTALKRYQDQMKRNPEDRVAAVSAVAGVCTAYPEGAALEALIAARPGVKVQIGLEALRLCAGKADSEGKG